MVYGQNARVNTSTESVRTNGGWRAPALWIVLAASLAYVAFLGWHWLPLDWSDKELSASASRVWDIRQAWQEQGELPWWTPNYMSGSSYGLNYARGFHLVPWLLLTPFFSFAVGGKLMALAAIFCGGVGMFFCARYFLKHDWAAALAAFAFLLHPEQLTRAMTQEHMPIITFMPFIPLVWWTFARALDARTWRNVFFCAVVVVLAMWADVKQLVVQGVFLTGYLAFWCWRNRAATKAALLTCAKITGASLVLGAFIVVPGLTEQPHIKLFLGDPLVAWQKTYGLHSGLGLVDRGGSLTRASMDGVRQAIQSGALRPTSQEEVARLQTQVGEVMGLQMDSPEKYAGLVLLLLVAGAALFNTRRQDRWLFWFSVGMLLLAVMLGSGLRSVWTGTWTVFGALWSLPGVTSETQMALLFIVAAVVGGLVWLARKKITTPAQWWLVGGTLAVFLFVPGFKLLAVLPYFKEIRAPGVFYALPFAYFGALLAGFFVTDVLAGERYAGKWRLGVGLAAVLMLVDYWPYQKDAKDNGVPARTLRNLEATYGALKQDSDMVKTYSLSGRYFHLLGPKLSGKPQVYEAFYNWMAPIGLGLLNQTGLSKEFFNLVGARYIILDKTDPSMGPNQQLSEALRKMYPVALENEDFAVFRNATARGYVTAYAGACAFVGDVRESAGLTLALAAQDWPLVQRPASDRDLARYTRVYPGVAQSPPPMKGTVVPLTDLQVRRETHGRLRINATVPTNCWAVVAESYYPFWRAEVDGRTTEVLRVSTGLMGVELPAGKHEVVLRYIVPRRYVVAGVLSAVALLAGLAGVMWERQRQRLAQ